MFLLRPPGGESRVLGAEWKMASAITVRFSLNSFVVCMLDHSSGCVASNFASLAFLEIL